MSLPGGERAIRPLARAGLLAGSGLLSSLALAAFASGRLDLVAAQTTSSVLRAISLQVLAVTIGKWGGDSLAFAIASGNPEIGLNLWRRVARRCVPAGMPVAIILFAVGGLSRECVFALAVSVAADMVAIQAAADLNARGRFGITAGAALLNYPLFVVCVALASRNGVVLDLAGVLWLFSGTSIARLLWCVRFYQKYRPATLVDSSVELLLAGQQCLNVCVYRADQLIVGALGLVRFGGGALSEAFFLFLVRFPELVSSGVTALGPAYLPRVYAASAQRWSDSLRSRGPAYALVTTPIMIGGIVVFSRLAPGWSVSTFWDVLPFACSGVLSAPVYALSYSMIRAGALRALVRLLGSAIVLGAAIAAIAMLLEIPRVLYWTVPAQLLAVALGGAFVNWRATGTGWR
jgi:hypothetical protein